MTITKIAVPELHYEDITFASAVVYKNVTGYKDYYNGDIISDGIVYGYQSHQSTSLPFVFSLSPFSTTSGIPVTSFTNNEKTVYWATIGSGTYGPTILQEGGENIQNPFLKAQDKYAWVFFYGDWHNPYSNGGNSTTGGGGGSYNNGSDNIGTPSLPSISAIQTGFCSMYNPTLAQINSLASWLWTDSIITNLTKLFGEPMKAIIGLSLCPVTPSTSGSVSVKLGNLDSGVSMPAVSNQYVQKDCGTVSLSEYYGAAMDYAPFTQVQLYVPYCGIYTIDIDDVMNGTSNLVYNIDVLTGACSAMLTCNKNNLNSVVYNFTGNVNTNIPVTSQDWTQVIRSVIGAASTVGAAIVTGGASMAATAGTEAAGRAAIMAGAGEATASMGAATNILGSAKPSISRGGGISTAMGALSVQTPYFIISRPVQSIPEKYQHYSGLPSNITATLSDVTGFTVMESIFINISTATEDEKNEIETLLKGGVIL
jgi:hypothetical protein